MRRFKRKLKKLLLEFIWLLATFPIVLAYRLLRWLFTAKKHVNAGGYILKKSKSGQLMLEHRWVAEKTLGRQLEYWEVVHHINGRRADNRPSNLCVMPRYDHIRYHQWYDWIKLTYKKYPRRTTQLKKLTEDFNGTLLVSNVKKRKTS